MWKWSSALTIVYCEVSTEFLEVHLDQVFKCAFMWGLLMLNPLSQSGNVCCVVCGGGGGGGGVCVCVYIIYLCVCIVCGGVRMCVWCVCVLCVGHSLVPRPSHPSMCRLQQPTNAGVRRPGNDRGYVGHVCCVFILCVCVAGYVCTCIAHAYLYACMLHMYSSLEPPSSYLP